MRKVLRDGIREQRRGPAKVQPVPWDGKTSGASAKLHLVGVWLATRKQTHWFFHNNNDSICGLVKREEILLGYLHVNHCKKCMYLVARTHV